MDESYLIITASPLPLDDDDKLIQELEEAIVATPTTRTHNDPELAVVRPPEPELDPASHPEPGNLEVRATESLPSKKIEPQGETKDTLEVRPSEPVRPSTSEGTGIRHVTPPLYLPVDRFSLCWRCGYPGHSRRECTKPHRIFCSRCGQYDIMSRDCPCPNTQTRLRQPSHEEQMRIRRSHQTRKEASTQCCLRTKPRTKNRGIQCNLESRH